MKRAAPWLCIAMMLVADAAFAAAPAGRPSPAPPTRPSVFDISRRADVNQLNVYLSNLGSTAHDISSVSAGLTYPRGSFKTAVFSAGLWLGATVNGQVRVALAEYTREYDAGAILPGGAPDDPGLNRYQVYKVARYTGDPLDTANVHRTVDEIVADPGLDPILHQSWSQYIAGAAPSGAPTRIHRLPVTSTPDPSDSVDVRGPDFAGDQMTWTVFNDADAERHTNSAGQTLPLGVEVQQTTFAFNVPGALDRTLFIRYLLINKSPNTLHNFYVTQWVDPDLGGASDDMVGCDKALGLGYCYNATNSDAVYGSEPPAIGYMMLQGLRSDSGDTLGLTAFQRYFNGVDPSSPASCYYGMQGLQTDGSPVIDPSDGFPTTYEVTGDPLAGTGWLDHAPADRRMTSSSGPITFAPGDTQSVVLAIVVGQGNDRLSSIAALRQDAAVVRDLYLRRFAAPGACLMTESCPGSVEYWQHEAGLDGSPQHTHAALAAIAAQVDTESVIFNWQTPEKVEELNVALANESDVRWAAKRRYAALLANASVWNLCLPVSDGGGTFIVPSAPVSYPPFAVSTIGELLAPPSTDPPTLRDAGYRENVPIHRLALAGVDASFEAFNGGAGFGSSFFGSTLNPFSQPDSFVTVELRFDHTSTQKAYRYLRLELADTSNPPGGREYRYGGFHDVNFTCWDVTNGVQLDVAFVERAVVDADGTILGAASQFATFDSTWAPDASNIGGREYLFVLSRLYSETPKPALMSDGLLNSGSMPVLYALWSRLRSPSDAIDDGDAFQFIWGPPVGTGLDDRFLLLEPQSLDDPDVVAAYAGISYYLEAINAGLGIGAVCGPAPVADVPGSGPPGPRHQLELSSPWPNPARDALRVSFILPTRGDGCLELLDVAGRRLLGREVGSLGPGRHTVDLAIDGRVRAGVYFLRLTQLGRAASRKAVVLR